MSYMMDLLKKIYPLRLAPVSDETDGLVPLLTAELPFTVHEYQSGLEHNGWTVPLKWKPIKAEIRKDGRMIYDGMKHPLGVIGYGTSFQGVVPLNELKKHLYYHPELPDSLVYHCDYYYKQWLRDWGFSVPQTLYQELPEGEYEVELITQAVPGTMKVFDYLLPGTTPDTVILNAHNCHAGQANDDIAGVVTAIQVIRTLSQRKKRRYGYRVIIAPEHLGTVFYLAQSPKSLTDTFKYAMFLEMVGNDNALSLQESFTGQSLIDRAAHCYLTHHQPGYHSDGFRKIVGNDETVWEAPGFEIPCISLTRYPYGVYHSDKDNEDIIIEQRLTDTVETVLGIIDILETNTVMQRHFNGLVALSNPKYDLYITPGDPSILPIVSRDQRKWNYLMDCLVRYFDQETQLIDIALKHEIEYAALYNYVTKFEEKGLITLRDRL
ncbi:MAG: DUF4910 domain-containing protein [Deltaproteobacteria bacterium]|nr:DUF4910 domain-containing protein [Deltaproteobacteria bacterium]